jgi:hypothetical protein
MQLWLGWKKGKEHRRAPVPPHIQAAILSGWGVIRLGMAGRYGRNKPLGKNDAGVKQGSVCKGYGPYNPADPFYLGGRLIDVQGKAESGVRGQHLSGGKANAMLAEVNSPGIVFPHTGKVIPAGDFGKTENMMAGDTDGAAAIDWRRIDSPGGIVKTGQQLIVTATGVMAGKAKRDNMLFHREKQANFNQLAGVAGAVPVWADRFLHPVRFPGWPIILR